MNDKEKFEFVNENLEDQNFLLKMKTVQLKKPTIKVELTEEELKLRKRKNKRKFILKINCYYVSYSVSFISIYNGLAMEININGFF